MKKFRLLRIILLLLMSSFITVNAAVWYVHPDSTLNSIQAGIDSSSTGDTVLVVKGTYIENINFKGKAITVKSELGRDSTIIDGSSPAHPDSGTVVYFMSGEGTASVLDGFTITGGTGTFEPGVGRCAGGIGCLTTSPKIINNKVYGNSAAYGGGIDCEVSAHPTISNNIIKENSATLWGGGIDIFNSSPKLTDNEISENTAHGNGGGIACTGSSSPTIKRNTITVNTASHGGGINCYSNATPTIDSCEISNNTGAGIYCHGNSTPVINYNNIKNNQGYGVRNTDETVTVNAEYNWWGDSTGPYHPDSNPSGLGSSVSDYVDFDPWSPTKAGVEEESDIEFLYISGCYPNPFIERTQIEYNLPITSDVNISAYNLFGARVKSLLNKRQNAGRYTITWNGSDEGGNKLPSGLYFLRLEAGADNETRKLLLVR